MELKAKPQVIIAAVMAVGFFLPWAQLFGFGVSGYNLGQIGSYGNWAWLVLVSSITTVVMFSTNQDEKLSKMVAYITGLIPIAGLLYGLDKLGSGLFHLISIGVYVCVFGGMGLIMVTASQNFQSSSPSPSQDS